MPEDQAEKRRQLTGEIERRIDELVEIRCRMHDRRLLGEKKKMLPLEWEIVRSGQDEIFHLLMLKAEMSPDPDWKEKLIRLKGQLMKTVSTGESATSNGLRYRERLKFDVVSAVMVALESGAKMEERWPVAAMAYEMWKAKEKQAQQAPGKISEEALSKARMNFWQSANWAAEQTVLDAEQEKSRESGKAPAVVLAEAEPLRPTSISVRRKARADTESSSL